MVIGNEGKGVSDFIQKHATEFVYIPMPAERSHINAAVAASIIMYESFASAVKLIIIPLFSQENKKLNEFSSCISVVLLYESYSTVEIAEIVKKDPSTVRDSYTQKTFKNGNEESDLNEKGRTEIFL